MSESDATSPSPAPATPEPRKPKPVRQRTGSGVLAPLAFLLSLLALAAVAFGAWHWWQSREARAADRQTMTQVTGQISALQGRMDSLHAQHAAQQARLQRQWRADAGAVQQQLAGLNQRTHQLEGAVQHLARGDVGQGKRALLLDQAQMLLRMGEQRYALFHDAAGATHAFALADQVLAAAHDPALAGVRQTLQAERKALTALDPAGREADLALLTRLRQSVMDLPLKSASTSTPASSDGFWSRLWHGLSRTVVVQRVDGSSRLAASGLSRQLLALDLAQAEAARLAWNDAASRTALQQAGQALDAWFDGQSPTVMQVRKHIQQLLAQPASSKVSLGAALQQLQDLRGMQAIEGVDAPAAATSTATGART